MKKITFILSFILFVAVGTKAQKIANSFLFVNTSVVQFYEPSEKILNNEEVPKFALNGKILTAKNLAIGTRVDIFSVLGAKVYSYTYNGEAINLNLNKGIYIIKADKYTQKIML